MGEGAVARAIERRELRFGLKVYVQQEEGRLSTTHTHTPRKRTNRKENKAPLESPKLQILPGKALPPTFPRPQGFFDAGVQIILTFFPQHISPSFLPTSTLPLNSPLRQIVEP